jgi:hypothetical protein
LTDTPPLTGQEIALAANATRALLDSLLVEVETSFRSWVILDVTATNGGRVERDAVVGRLRSALKVDTATASATIDDAVSPGLAALDGDQLVLTPEGTTRSSRSVPARRRSSSVSTRIPTTVTERANAELAGGR